MALDPHDLPPAALAFLRERHLATLTTLRPDGSPHVVPVGFTWDDGTARIITSGASRKVAHVGDDPRVALCQVDGRRWLTLEGTAAVLGDPDAVRDAVERYAARYREPRPNPRRVVIAVDVERMLGSGLD